MSADRFDREAFCEVFAEILSRPPSASRVISLEGEWGEGKTTAIEAITHLLGERHADRRPFVVRVTPWVVGGVQDMVQFLLSEFAVLLPREKKRIRFWGRIRIAIRLARYADALAATRSEPSTAVASITLQALAWISNRWWAAAMNLDAIKGRLAKSLAELNRPIVVFIDDLDRLLPAEVLSVVRFARAVGDFPGVTYVLAYDHARVTEALDKADVPNPALFLDKVVGMRMHLPPPSPEAIRGLLFDSIASSEAYSHRRQFDSSDDRLYEILDFHLSGAVPTPRAVERIVSKVESVPHQIYRDVEFWDVVGVSAISIVAPEVFDMIRARSRFFVGEWKDFPDIGGGNDVAFEAFKADLSRILDKLQRPHGRYVMGLLETLFPWLSEGGDASPEMLELNGRIGGPRGLYTYLRMALGESGIPLALVDAVIRGGQGVAADLRISAGTLPRFSALIALVEERLRPNKSIDPITSAQCFRLLVDHWGWLNAADRSAAYRIDQARPMIRICSDLLATASDGWGLIDYALRSENSIAVGALLLDFSAGRSGGSHFPIPKLDEKARASLASRMADRLESGLRDDEIEAGDLTGMAYALLRVSQSDFDGLMARVAGTSDGRRRLLSVLGVTLSSGPSGDIAHWPVEVRKLAVIGPLSEEAKIVLEDQVVDKRLSASSRALISGIRILVATGEPDRL